MLIMGSHQSDFQICLNLNGIKEIYKYQQVKQKNSNSSLHLLISNFRHETDITNIVKKGRGKCLSCIYSDLWNEVDI